MSEPATSGVEAAPPPPGTVVWSMFSWSELLVDNPWLDARWAPVAGTIVDERELPDAQRRGLVGQTGDLAGVPHLATRAGAAVHEPAARSVPLSLYLIR